MAVEKSSRESLVQALADIQEEKTLALAQELLDEGVPALEILELARRGSEIVGERFDRGEYFLSELMMAGEMMNAVTEMVKPHVTQASPAEPLGKLVIGTVKGDIHNIGKNMVVFLFSVNGFDVHDLGDDVSPEHFVEAIREVQPDIVGMSGLLTVSYESMKATIEAIAAAGLRDKVHIIVGGALVDERAREYVGADAYRPNPASAIVLAREWVGR